MFSLKFSTLIFFITFKEWCALHKKQLFSLPKLKIDLLHVYNIFAAVVHIYILQFSKIILMQESPFFRNFTKIHHCNNLSQKAISVFHLVLFLPVIHLTFPAAIIPHIQYTFFLTLLAFFESSSCWFNLFTISASF